MAVHGHDLGLERCEGPRAGSSAAAFLCEATSVGERISKRVLGRRFAAGFSLVELLLSVLILCVLVAISLPTLMRAYRSYQLNDAATRFSSTLKTTRFSAIRKNTAITCRVQQTLSTWIVWADLDGDGTAQSTEPQILIGGIAMLLGASSVPPPDAIVAALGTGSPTLHVLSPGNASVAYDARGARQFTGAPSVDVFYLGNTNISDLGFRAIVLLPSGTVQVWTAGVGGPWLRIS
jgi:prepilin-type N-terminal cleavage/methylation domain-containing protein